MSLLLGIGVIALLVVGVGRWVRPNRSKTPASPVPSAPPAQAPQTVDGGTLVAEPVAPGAGLEAQTPGSWSPTDPWAEARRLRALLLAREVPTMFTSWQLVAEPGEVFFFELGAEYERFYGREVGFRPASGFYFGSPAFILAGLAVSGVTNARRRSAAQAEGATQWRERETIRFVVTNHRLLCLVGGRWTSFHYAAMTAVYPEVAAGVLVAEFQGVPPLRLTGPDTAVASVMTVFATHGLAAVAEHPSLRALD